MRHRARATPVRKQRLGGNGELRAGDFVRGRFVAGARYPLFDDDQLRLGSSGDSQMLQDCDAGFVRPVEENPANKEDCDVFLPHWLRVEETVDLRNPSIGARAWEMQGWNATDLAASRAQSRVRRACFCSSTALNLICVRKKYTWKLELMRIVPHGYHRSQPRDLAPRSEGWGGDEQVLMTEGQRRLQHR